jgi:hypothetical protein
MTRGPKWFDFSWRCGVLELPEALTAPGPALELHLETDIGGMPLRLLNFATKAPSHIS